MFKRQVSPEKLFQSRHQWQNQVTFHFMDFVYYDQPKVFQRKRLLKYVCLIYMSVVGIREFHLSKEPLVIARKNLAVTAFMFPDQIRPLIGVLSFSIFFLISALIWTFNFSFARNKAWANFIKTCLLSSPLHSSSDFLRLHQQIYWLLKAKFHLNNFAYVIVGLLFATIWWEFQLTVLQILTMTLIYFPSSFVGFSVLANTLIFVYFTCQYLRIQISHLNDDMIRVSATSAEWLKSARLSLALQKHTHLCTQIDGFDKVWRWAVFFILVVNFPGNLMLTRTMLVVETDFITFLLAFFVIIYTTLLIFFVVQQMASVTAALNKNSKLFYKCLNNIHLKVYFKALNCVERASSLRIGFTCLSLFKLTNLVLFKIVLLYIRIFLLTHKKGLDSAL